MDKLQKLKQEMYDIAIKTYSTNPEYNEMTKWNLISMALEDAIRLYTVTHAITKHAQERGENFKEHHRRNIVHKFADALIQTDNIQTEEVPVDPYTKPEWQLYEDRSTSKLWVLK